LEVVEAKVERFPLKVENELILIIALPRDQAFDFKENSQLTRLF
jgi:hypothetical protein